MNKSESIINLAAALSKLQNEIQNAYADEPGYGYKYVKLSSILESCRPLLSKHELAVSQLCENSATEPDIVGVETVLMHSSGQYVSSTLHMRVTAGKGMSAAQAAGSVITYARRYALAAILGIAQTDDDASIKHIEGQPAKHIEELLALIENHNLSDKTQAWCDFFKVKALHHLDENQARRLIEMINEKQTQHLTDKIKEIN